MKLNKNTLCLLLITYCLAPTFTYCQDDKTEECPSSSTQAVKLYEKSRDKKKYDYPERINFLEKSLEEDPDYAPTNYELGLHYQRRADEADGTCPKCEKYFLAVVKNCPKFHSNPYFFLGKFYFEQDKYDTAINYFKMFLDFKEDDVKKYDKLRFERFLVDAKRYIAWAKFYKETYGNPVPFDPKILEGVSTTYDEFLPFISPDNEFCFYTRRLPVRQMNQAWTSDSQRELFCFSTRQANGKFDVGGPMPTPPFNINYKEGGACVTVNNKHLYYTIFDAGGNADIYSSDYVNGNWTATKNLGHNINSPDFWDSQPAISADGNTIYFASNRIGGYGGVDIWKSEKDAAGQWQPAINLGPKINTEGDEKSPFLHWDSKTLYFSSGDNESGYSSHMSLGGFDIFYSRLDSTGKWNKPKNIGYPINTEADDIGFFVSSDGKYGIFGSNHPNKTKGLSVGGLDFYYFDLYPQARPDEVALIKGKVTDDKGNAVAKAEVILKDAVTKKETKAIIDSASGEYVVVANIQKKNDMLLQVKKEGNAFTSQLLSQKDPETKKMMTSIDLNAAKTESIEINMETKPIEVGKAYTLNNLYFDQNRADLKSESTVVLDEFATYLKENPTVKININGHTDNVGSEVDNKNLSTDRAFTVFEYLRAHGVNKEQISAYAGFGATQPIAPNDTEEGRAKNRRTEFLIVSK